MSKPNPPQSGHLGGRHNDPRMRPDGWQVTRDGTSGPRQTPTPRGSVRYGDRNGTESK